MRLMISVVSAGEAREALCGGAEILDVKNPAEGSLGAQPPTVLRDVKSLLNGGTKLSAALGDLPNLPGTAALAALGAAACGADYIKAGLYGPRTAAESVALLREVRRAVAGFATAVIAAAYADFERAGTIDPALLPEIAAASGVQGFLLDTLIKDGKPLLSFADPDALRSLAGRARALGLLFGVAGALRAEDLSVVRDCGADIAGVRSAACRGNRRQGPLEEARVLQLRRILVPAV